MDDFSNALSALGADSQGAPAAAPSSSVPPGLLKAVIATESGGNPNAVSPKGARGVMQVMPATNSDPGFGVSPARDGSEAERTRVGQDYLGALHDRYRDPALTAIAYNMGPGATDKWLQNGGDFSKLPAETQGYVGKVMTHAAVNGRASQAVPAAAAPAQSAPAANDDFSNALAQLSAPEPAQAPAANIPRIEIRGTSADVRPGESPPISPGTAGIGTGLFDLHANQVTGLGSTIAGGLAGIGTGLYKLARTGDVGQAVDAGANTVKAVQEAGTYQPRTAEGQKMVELFGSNYNPLAWIPNASQAIGDKAGGALEDAGYGAAGALVKGAGAAAPLLLGRAMKPLSGMLKGASDVAEVPRVDPTMKPAYKLVDGKPVLLSDLPQGQTVTQQIPQPQAPVGGTTGTNGTTSLTNPAPVVSKPTLAQATPELQKAVADAAQKGIAIDPDVLRRHINADTLPVPVKITTGQAAANPELISNEMNSRGKGQAAPVSPDFYNQQAKDLSSNLEVLRAKAAPDIPTTIHPTEAGQMLIDEYKKMDAPVRADITAKYKALEQANGGQFPMNGKDFMAAADAALDKNNKAEFLPTEIKNTLAKYRDGGPMTFNNFENLRTILATAGRKADAAADGNASHAISTVRESLESLPMTAETATIKPLADAARGAAKARFDAMKADPAYKAAAGDSVKAGEPSPLAEKFVPSYLINGKGAYVKNMKSNLAGSDTAGQAIAAAGMDYLQGMAKADSKTGTFMSANYNKGLKQLGPKIGDIFDPETAQHVQQVGQVAKDTSSAPRGSFVNSSNSATALGSPAMQSTIATAKVAAEHGTNMAFGGIPIGTIARKGAQIVGDIRAGRAAAADSKASTDPLAGFKKLSDLTKP